VGGLSFLGLTVRGEAVVAVEDSVRYYTSEN
jgi:hypothetical protein